MTDAPTDPSSGGAPLAPTARPKLPARRRPRWPWIAVGAGAVGVAAVAAALALRADGPLADAPDTPAPQPGVDVTSVELRLRVDPATRRLAGRAALDVRHPADLGALRLGLDDALAVELVRVDGQPVQAARDGDGLAVPVGGSASRVEVVYGGVPSAGVYGGEAAGQAVVWTDGWPTRTAGWLPAVHHPSDPFALDLTLVVPAAVEAVASGAPVSDAVDGGTREARFRLDADAPSYTMAWALGDFETVEQEAELAGGRRLPVRHHLLAADADQTFGLRRTPRVLAVLDSLLGPYPYPAYATVQVPLVFAGMENAAAPFLQAALYRGPADVLEEVNVHELVHQWWGDDVVPSDWRHLWLAEGPATYLTTLVARELDGDDAWREALVRMALVEPADARRRLVPEALREPEAALTATVYQKGGAFLHVLHRTVGDDAFGAGLREAVRAYADAPLTTAAFADVMGAAAGRDLGPLFDFWARGTELPAVRVRWDRATNTLAWETDGAGGIDGIGLELYVAQGAARRYVPLDDGVATLPGAEAPEVYPVGFLAEIQGP